jgi:hypothetical protein
MSFFNLSTGEQANTSGTMEMGGGDIEPIPAKTQVKAAIEEASWYTPKDGGDTVISLKWAVLAPKEYANRKVFQKLKVKDSDPKKRDKAIMMLGAIDKNCGGKLFASGQEPTDDTLMMCLLNKPMVLLLQVWAMDDPNTGEKKKGNWVAAVSPISGQAAQAAQTAKPAPVPFDDDITF